MFGGNFAPNGWMLCQGQTIPISENETLFNLIGTTYGGDGQETFQLPNLQGCVPIHQGTLAGGATYVIGQTGGTEQVTLTTQQIPNHSHVLKTTTGGQQLSPANGVMASAASTQSGVMPYYTGASDGTQLNPASMQPAGGSQPHENMQPFLVVNFIISLYGVYPTPT
ncbi:MAG TPA: tail fiber protein [Caulobacteraceae bacterium]|nr:tail fiber protein [Caulobacteraceae bacterium]